MVCDRTVNGPRVRIGVASASFSMRSMFSGVFADDTVFSENRAPIFIYGNIIPRAHAVAEPASCAFLAVAHEVPLGKICKRCQEYTLENAEDSGE